MSDELPPEQETPDTAAETSGEPESGRRTMIMIVAAAVVVLVAIGVGVYLVATSGEDDVAADPGTPTITGSAAPEPPASTPPPSEPPASPAPSKAPPPAPDKNVAAARTAAEQAADAINERDVDAMQQLSCDPAAVGSVEEFPPEATARLTENPQITGDKATAQIELSISGSEPTVVPLPMEKRNGKWCVP
jgi:type IV secretory pathway VirB10-like protein